MLLQETWREFIFIIPKLKELSSLWKVCSTTLRPFCFLYILSDPLWWSDNYKHLTHLLRRMWWVWAQQESLQRLDSLLSPKCFKWINLNSVQTVDGSGTPPWGAAARKSQNNQKTPHRLTWPSSTPLLHVCVCAHMPTLQSPENVGSPPRFLYSASY